MTDTTTAAKPHIETKRRSLAKARQVLANQRAEERERIFAQSGDRVANLPPRPVLEFEGLAPPTECCDACREGHCIISGTWYCAHPMGGGLQAKEKGDHTALKRFKRAKEYLKGAKLDLQKMSE